MNKIRTQEISLLGIFIGWSPASAQADAPVKSGGPANNYFHEVTQ